MPRRLGTMLGDHSIDDTVDGLLTGALRYLGQGTNPTTPGYLLTAAGAAVLATPVDVAHRLWRSAIDGYRAYANGDIERAGQLATPLLLGVSSFEDAGPSSEIANRVAAGNAAVDRVLNTQTDVPGAMIHPDLGPITFRWATPPGRGGFQHILIDHGEDAARNVPNVIANGQLGEPYLTPNGRSHIDIIHEGSKVVLSRDYFGAPENWVVSSYKIDR